MICSVITINEVTNLSAWDKRHAVPKTRKRLISRIHKELLQINKKKAGTLING